MRLRLMMTVLCCLTLGLPVATSARVDDRPKAEAVRLDEFESTLEMMNRLPGQVPGVPSLFAPAPGARNLLKILDTRSRADYDAGHIPRSIWVDIKQAQAIAARPGGLTDADAWVEWLTPLGLTEDSAVFVVDGDRQLEAARLWWLLRYLGVEHVALLDGNFGLWQMQKRPTSQEVPEVAPNPFRVRFRSDRLATRDDVLTTLKTKDARVIDARSVEEFVGKNLRAQRGGHIPDACRLEWLTFVDKYGRFLPKAEIEAKFAAAGIRPGEAVVTHCQGGGRASVDAFVFEMLGYPTRNFYLGWSDWGNAADTPISDAPEEAPRVVASAPVTVPAAANEARDARPAVSPRVDPAAVEGKAVPAPEPAAVRPFIVEYYYKAKWGHADEFLALFQRNHLPVLRERIKGGDILKVAMTKPRIHTGEADRWDFRVTIEFRDAASAFNPALDEPIKQRLFPDQAKYRAEEQRRFQILEGHTDLPIDEVDLDKPITAP